MERFNWQDITVVFDDKSLEIGNSKFRRCFDLSKGTLRTVLLESRQGQIFCGENSNDTDLECYGGFLPLSELGCAIKSINCRAVEDPEWDSPHALIEINMLEPFSKTQLTREFILYPEIAAYGLRNKVVCHVAPNFHWLSRPGMRENYAQYRTRKNEPLMDVFHPAEGFTPRRSVEFFGHTDLHDHPVVEHHLSPEDRYFSGNLLYCENADSCGVMMLQEAPPSSERRERENFDFYLDDAGDIHSFCWGILPEELMANCGKPLSSYRNMVAVYHNSGERERILKDYLRLRFENTSAQRKVVVNAWGCGSFGKRLSPEFLEAEIRAAGECGGEVYQVDDEWQSGGSLGQFAIKNLFVPLSDFWQVNEEKVGKGGFDRLRKIADESGIDLALWLAPSTNIFYRNHREFSDLVLDFHRKYGFDLFKVDNAGFPTLEAERNFETMLADVRRESGNKVYFNLDITAGMRGGFFRLLEYGSLFVENRYACHLWGVGYHPERTLRNMWKLSRYVRLQSLQMEVASPWDINPESYKQRNEILPDVYRWKFWAAVTLFTNPLLWFSPSSIPAERRGEIREIMELHKRYRELIFSGEIFPVGSEPSGSALTGFASKDQDGKILAVLLLREKDAEEETISIPGSELMLAGGEGTAESDRLTVREKGGFALFVHK